jgi:hypothetical protein
LGEVPGAATVPGSCAALSEEAASPVSLKVFFSGFTFAIAKGEPEVTVKVTLRPYLAAQALEVALKFVGSYA